jgi:hypothetical protein
VIVFSLVTFIRTLIIPLECKVNQWSVGLGRMVQFTDFMNVRNS